MLVSSHFLNLKIQVINNETEKQNLFFRCELDYWCFSLDSKRYLIFFYNLFEIEITNKIIKERTIFYIFPSIYRPNNTPSEPNIRSIITTTSIRQLLPTPTHFSIRWQNLLQVQLATFQ